MDAVDELLTKIETEILNPVIGLLVIIAMAVFIYGLVEFIGGADNEEKRNNGKRHMTWGIVGLFIMFTAFGLMRVADIFGGLSS